MLHKTWHVTRLVSIVSMDDWALAFKFVKDQCTCVVEGRIKEFERHFSAHELINATMIIYPQYWEGPEVENTSVGHLSILKAKFFHFKPK